MFLVDDLMVVSLLGENFVRFDEGWLPFRLDVQR